MKIFTWLITTVGVHQSLRGTSVQPGDHLGVDYLDEHLNTDHQHDYQRGDVIISAIRQRPILQIAVMFLFCLIIVMSLMEETSLAGQVVELP